MSINMDSDSQTDYSSFEYQTLIAQLDVEPAGDNNPNAQAVIQFEPLAAVGGLDNNEIAELVYLETQVAPEVEDEDNDQNVGTALEVRGNVGVNLPESQGAFVDPATPRDITGTVVGENSGVGQADIDGFTQSEDRFLQTFQAYGSISFDDSTNGPGGAGNSGATVYEKNYRELTGRGPVLDANDDISIAIAYNAGDIVAQVRGTVRCHMVWDVAETDDAGRRFSVPM